MYGKSMFLRTCCMSASNVVTKLWLHLEAVDASRKASGQRVCFSNFVSHKSWVVDKHISDCSAKRTAASGVELQSASTRPRETIRSLRVSAGLRVLFSSISASSAAPLRLPLQDLATLWAREVIIELEWLIFTVFYSFHHPVAFCSCSFPHSLRTLARCRDC